ncbi:mesothelin [Ctenodactylus gundi]
MGAHILPTVRFLFSGPPGLLPLSGVYTVLGAPRLLDQGCGWAPPLQAQTGTAQQEEMVLSRVLASRSDLARWVPGSATLKGLLGDLSGSHIPAGWARGEAGTASPENGDPVPSGDPQGLWLLRGFTCAEVSGLSVERAKELAVAVRHRNVTLRVDQLHCLARRLSLHLVPENLDIFPRDMLPFFNSDLFTGPQACTRFFSALKEANMDVLPPGAPQRHRLLLRALACLGVQGSRVSSADVRALGGLTCDLPAPFIASSAAAVLPRLASCPGPLEQDQQEAVRIALQSGGPPYGPPSGWSVSTLSALQGLLAMLDRPLIHTVPRDITAAGQHRAPQGSSRQLLELRSGLTGLPEGAEGEPRALLEKACPPERKAHTVDENLIFYEEWELEACVGGALLAEQVDRLDALPFTYQQLAIFKHTLDKTYPRGYPESLIRRLGRFFYHVSPEDIRKWNVTSLDTVKALLEVSKRPKMDAQVATCPDKAVWAVAALMAHSLLGPGRLDRDTLDILAGFPAAYLCILSPEQLGSLPPSVMWAVRPQDLEACNATQLGILYAKARGAFQNVSGLEFFRKIQAFLGGVPTEDLKAFSRQNVSMDMATFRRLPADTLKPLTVAEVRSLLGPHVVDLKAEEARSPVRDWIFQQQQEELDLLGLGLRGGVPNGYMVLDLDFRAPEQAQVVAVKAHTVTELNKQ